MKYNSTIKTSAYPQFILKLTFAGLLLIGPSSTASAQYANQIISYDPGSNPASGFTDPTSALGEPTRVTSPNSSFGGATTPFQAAFGRDELVSIGAGGHLTVAFDSPVLNDPGNPFGIDLLVFGNAFYTDASFPNGVPGGLFSEGGLISVSADGINFVQVPNVDADGAFPTLGYQDPTGTLTSFGNPPISGTIPTNFTKPVDPSFNPVGLSYADVLAGYNGSGGGAGVDIGALGLQEISYVRINTPIGASAPEIDGFADVAVPEPTSLVLLAFAVLLYRRR